MHLLASYERFNACSWCFSLPFLKFPESYKKVLSEVALILIFINRLSKFSVSETSSVHTSCLTQQLLADVDAGLTTTPGWSSTTRQYILAMNRADVDAQKFR